MNRLPALREFRAEKTEDNILHLVFDMPGRSMNVFSNAAIHEIEAFATWLGGSDLRGVVISSGKPTAFCAGADLGELGTAYDMIMAAPADDRTRVAREHFAPIGRAFRRLETAGKPVAIAINGLALGGGCEFALGCHYRVLADTPQTALGLPESLVGLFPGAGGTQRMPRLVGLEKALPILLDGARLTPAQALSGAAHEIVPAGEEVAAAERWIRSDPEPIQPWDRPDWRNPGANSITATIAAARKKILGETHGHYPAPLAILDCLERGFPERMDKALSIEIDIFADLIMRPEPRNMIQTLFLGKQDFDRRRKAGELPPELEAIKQDVAASLAAEAARTDDAKLDAAMRKAGFTKVLHPVPGDLNQVPVRIVPSGSGPASAGLWFEQPTTDEDRIGAKLLAAAILGVSARADALNGADKRIADYLIVRDIGFPAYLGGPFALFDYLGGARLHRILDA